METAVAGQPMSDNHQQPMFYQIRIQGHLDAQWTEWFAGLAISLEENGDTLLTGPVVDQAALHGLLKKIRDLGMLLLSVMCIEPAQTNLTETIANKEREHENN